MRKTILSALVCCLTGFATLAQSQTVPSITVIGEGSIAAPPDMAVISLGVTHQAVAAGDAMAEANDTVAGVLARLTGLGLAPEDIQTRRITLNPLWQGERHDSDKPPKITGFVASNMISVRVTDLDRLGTILDSVIADGANTFDGLRFSLQDPSSLQDEARKRAVRDAMARAALLAEAAGVSLGQVREIRDQDRGNGPVMMESALMRSASDAIATGKVSLRATVTMIFDIASP